MTLRTREREETAELQENEGRGILWVVSNRLLLTVLSLLAIFTLFFYSVKPFPHSENGYGVCDPKDPNVAYQLQENEKLMFSWDSDGKMLNMRLFRGGKSIAYIDVWLEKPVVTNEIEALGAQGLNSSDPYWMSTVGVHNFSDRGQKIANMLIFESNKIILTINPDTPYLRFIRNRVGMNTVKSCMSNHIQLEKMSQGYFVYDLNNKPIITRSR